MKPELLIVLAIFGGFVLLEIALTQFFNKPGQTRSDALVESISTGVLMFVTQPLAVAGGMGIAALVAPQWQDVLTHWPWLAVFGLFLIFDDMLQYWWHRLSHTLPWLYKLHRPHHNAAYLSIRVVYRNNIFYYLLMPGLW